MDPMATLALLRALAESDDSDLAEAFRALDEWIMGGGFLPLDWTSPVTTVHHRDGCGLCGDAHTHTHPVAQWRAFIDSEAN